MKLMIAHRDTNGKAMGRASVITFSDDKDLALQLDSNDQRTVVRLSGASFAVQLRVGRVVCPVTSWNRFVGNICFDEVRIHDADAETIARYAMAHGWFVDQWREDSLLAKAVVREPKA